MMIVQTIATIAREHVLTIVSKMWSYQIVGIYILQLIYLRPLPKTPFKLIPLKGETWQYNNRVENESPVLLGESIKSIDG